MTLQDMLNDERIQGKTEGLLEGKQIGLQRGEQIGLQRGEQIGLQRGEANKAVSIALKLLEMNEPIEKIALITELSIEEIKSLIKD